MTLRFEKHTVETEWGRRYSAMGVPLARSRNASIRSVDLVNCTCTETSCCSLGCHCVSYSHWASKAFERVVFHLSAFTKHIDLKKLLLRSSRYLDASLRLLAFVLRFHGVPSVLSGKPRKLEHWLLYNSKRCSIIKLTVDD